MFQVAEILSFLGEVGERKIGINLLYRWSSKENIFEKFAKSERMLNEIAMHTGMSKSEINKDLKNKEMILKWMDKYDISKYE